MFEYNRDIETILRRRVHSRLLEGYLGGIFNPEKDKFYAATLVDISNVNYEDFDYLHEQMQSHSASYFDSEAAKKYLPENSWQNKTRMECVEDGIYTRFAVVFWAVYYQDKWFIIESLTFYGSLIDKQGIEEQLKSTAERKGIWQQSLFEPEQPLKLSATEVIPISVGMSEFKEAPWMVAHLKQRKKESINLNWCRYFNEDIIDPFFEKLSIVYPDQYLRFIGLRYNFTMIFPELKQHVLFCCFAEDAYKKWRLHYFMFNYQTRKYYNWTHFKPISFDYNFFYGDIIINDLRQISHWDDESYLDSSCTMDDDNFWNNHVFAQNNGEYLHLQEI